MPIRDAHCTCVDEGWDQGCACIVTLQAPPQPSSSSPPSSFAPSPPPLKLPISPTPLMASAIPLGQCQWLVSCQQAVQPHLGHVSAAEHHARSQEFYLPIGARHRLYLGPCCRQRRSSWLDLPQLPSLSEGAANEIVVRFGLLICLCCVGFRHDRMDLDRRPDASWDFPLDPLRITGPTHASQRPHNRCNRSSSIGTP